MSTQNNNGGPPFTSYSELTKALDAATACTEKAEAELAQLRAEVERLNLELTALGDLAVGYWDDSTVGRVDATLPHAKRETYKDQLKTLFGAHDVITRLRTRAEKSERLWKEFITLMDIMTDESDSGYAFNVNKISSCRAMDGKRLNEILNEARTIVF